ncbi:DUF3089 domain-containing protein [Croceivirga radicis]|uniref:DUF3089 domain-containing protein n=1 Tax=Croceivirga radicis TaxID=1929488 RepID=UPI000255B55F|nr:DUF3089 domain-containing protein [Croceivirga radicis]
MKNWIKLLLLLPLFGCADQEPVSETAVDVPVITVPTSTIDFTAMANWYYHPEQSFNFLKSYNLDIAVVDAALQTSSVVAVPNKATTNTGVDVFWVHPTHLTNPPTYPTTIAIENQDTNYIGLTILAQGALLAKYGRFFAPKYRQASPASFLSTVHTETEKAQGILEAYADIKAAFLHYLNTYNNGNKIILAGHSQGSFLLALLVRDVFDNNPKLREQLVTAALGGMGYVYATTDTTLGGWWQNIGLCKTQEQCGCVHYWRSYSADEPLPEPNIAFPSFSETLVQSGLVNRATQIEADVFFQDSLAISSAHKPIRYITPGAPYSFSNGYNFVAFDQMYSGYFKRESDQKVGFAIKYDAEDGDERPNELQNLDNPILFSEGDYHVKDYHIYIWPLLQQIDQKLSNCL